MISQTIERVRCGGIPMSSDDHRNGAHGAAPPEPSGLSRRDRILRAAVAAFAARGFDGASTREIAEAAGIKVPLLFYHFKSKADLYLTAVLDQIAKLAEGLDVALSDERDVYAQLRTFVEVYLRYFIDLEPGLTVTLQELHGLPEEVAAAIRTTHHDEVTARLERILARGIAESAFRPVDVPASAQAIIGILHIFLRIQMRVPDRFSRAEVITQVCDVYAAGLRPTAVPEGVAHEG
jgi:AcrR family transcriptional regulator